MWRKLLSRNIIPYTITLLVIFADFAIVFFVTLWTPEFDTLSLRQSSFWLEQAVKTTVSLIAYFAFVYFSSTLTSRSTDIEMLRFQIMQNYDFVIINMLTDTRDAFVDIKNGIEKAKAYLSKIDKKLKRIKDDEKKRGQLNAEKALIAEFLKIQVKKLSGEDVPIEEVEELNKKFNINSVGGLRYFYIDKRLLDGSNAVQNGRKLGHFNKGKHIAADFLYKLIPSMMFIILVSVFMPGLFDKSKIQSTIFLSIVVLANCLFGWLEGYNLINRFERSSLNEIKLFYGDFFNFCVAKKELSKEKLIENNEKSRQELMTHFTRDYKKR